MRDKALSEYFSGNADDPDLDVEKLLDCAKNFLHIKSFPCNFGEGKWIKDKEIVKFPINEKVIDNFKRLFAHEVGVNIKLAMKEEGYEELDSFGPEPVSSSDLLCVSFRDVFGQGYFREALWSEMKEYGYGKEEIKRFWEIPFPAINSERIPHFPRNKIYLKDIDLGFIKAVSEITKQNIANQFAIPSTDKKKMKHYKDVSNTLISIPLEEKDKVVSGGYREELVNGGFAFVPIINMRYLTSEDAEKINDAFKHLGCGSILTDVKDQIRDKSTSDGKVYFTKKVLPYLILLIVRNALINKEGEFVADCTCEQEKKCIKEHVKQQPSISKSQALAQSAPQPASQDHLASPLARCKIF